MAATKEEKLEKLMDALAEQCREPLVEMLQEKQVISKKDFARLTGLLVDAFDELLADTPNQKRMLRKLRDYGTNVLNLEYETDIEDDTLRYAVKVIRERIIRKSEREKLARLIAKEVIDNWITMDEERVEYVAGFDGLLESIQEKTEGDFEFSDSDLADKMLELGAILCARYLERLDEEQLDGLLERCTTVARMVEQKEDFGDELLSLCRDVLQQLGVIALMRRAFAGLLLSDLIIRQIGKSFGIKDKISVTDFIIFIGVKVFEAEELKNADANRIKKTREIFESVLDT